MSPRTPARGAAGLRPPACGPPLPSLPVAGWASGQACGTLRCTHGIAPEPCALSPLLPPPTPFTPSVCAPYVCCPLGTPAAPLPRLLPRDLRTSPGGHRPRSGLHCRRPRPRTPGLAPLVRLRLLIPASLSPRHITPFRSPLARFLFRPMTQCAQSRTLQSMRRAPLLPLSLRSPYRRPPAR